MKTAKFVLMALVAVALCSGSCNKDPEPKPGPNNDRVPEGKAKVVFGDQDWLIGWSDCGVVEHNGAQILFVNAAPSQPTSMFPMLYFTVTAETGRHMASTDANLFMMFFKEKVFNLVDQNGNPILSNAADYWAGNGPVAMGTANIEINSIDLSTLTVDLVGEGAFWNAMTYLQSETVQEIAYKLDFNKFKLTPRSSKDMAPVSLAEATQTIVY